MTQELAAKGEKELLGLIFSAATIDWQITKGQIMDRGVVVLLGVCGCCSWHHL